MVIADESYDSTHSESGIASTAIRNRSSMWLLTVVQTLSVYIGRNALQTDPTDEVHGRRGWRAFELW